MPEYEDKTKNAKDGYTILERICNVLEAEICPGIAASPLLAFQLLDSITNTLANWFQQAIWNIGDQITNFKTRNEIVKYQLRLVVLAPADQTAKLTDEQYYNGRNLLIISSG